MNGRHSGRPCEFFGTSGFILLVVLAAPGPASAQDLQCPSNRPVMVGVHGQQGWWMDQVGPVCASIRSDGSIGSTADGPSAGGDGGTRGRYVCPGGRVVTRLTWRTGQFVDTVDRMTCADWNTGTLAPGGRTVAQNAFPVKGRSRTRGTTCSDGTVAVGLTVRAGLYVDRISRVICEPAPGSMGGAAARAAGRGPSGSAKKRPPVTKSP